MEMHVLKIWPAAFEAVIDEVKTWEVRYADREFKPNDRLILREWNSEQAEYTGRECIAYVGYVDDLGKYGVDNYVGMSISLTPQ